MRETDEIASLLDAYRDGTSDVLFTWVPTPLKNAIKTHVQEHRLQTGSLRREANLRVFVENALMRELARVKGLDSKQRKGNPLAA